MSGVFRSFKITTKSSNPSQYLLSKLICHWERGINLFFGYSIDMYPSSTWKLVFNILSKAFSKKNIFMSSSIMIGKLHFTLLPCLANNTTKMRYIPTKQIYYQITIHLLSFYRYLISSLFYGK